MKYKLFEDICHGGINDRVEEVLIGEYRTKEEAISEAKKRLGKYQEIVIRQPEKDEFGYSTYTDLDGNKDYRPLSGFVIEGVEK